MITHDYLLYIAIFFTAFSLSSWATPFSKKLAIKLGAVDQPKERGMHDKPMPRLGGAAIVFGFLGALLILYPFYYVSLPSGQLIGFLIGAIIIVALGFTDDVKSVRPRIKFIIQFIAAGIVVYSGVRIDVVMWPFTVFLQIFSIPITIIWIVGVTNAVNLIDGLDGLAAGVSSIAALCLMVLCIMTGNPLAVVLTANLAGACLGFLPRNFNPAETFMGDTGSTFLGYVLGVTSIIGVFKGYAVLAVIVSILTLGLPLLDTFFAMARRILRGQSIMQADRGHLHHRLIDKGMSQKQAVYILYFVSIFFGVIAILVSLNDIWALVIGIAVFAVIGGILFVYTKNKKGNSEN